MTARWSLVLLLMALPVAPAWSQTADRADRGAGDDRIGLSLLFVGTLHDLPSASGRAARTKEFVDYLSTQFTSVTVADREHFDPASADDVDVVLLDWSQREVNITKRNEIRSPIGEREAWRHPTVLLGSAGVLLDQPWQLKGEHGCTCLAPFAYGLRDHAIFASPRRVDRASTIKRKTPDHWKGFIAEPEIDVLPVVREPSGRFEAGWVAIDEGLEDSPDIEVFCGGINDKAAVGAAVWRQGQFLHFGFEQSPSQMNEVGRAMLVNAIAYIARFHEDQAICRVGGNLEPRAMIAGWLENEKFPLDLFKMCFAPELLRDVEGSREAYRVWFAAHRASLLPGADWMLAIDAQASALGSAGDQVEVFDRAVAALEHGGELAASARELLEKRAPEPPAASTAEAWRAWLAENRPYLFFSDRGGYRWYIDPLAKARGRPTAELRGIARADAE